MSILSWVSPINLEILLMVGSMVIVWLVLVIFTLLGIMEQSWTEVLSLISKLSLFQMSKIWYLRVPQELQNSFMLSIEYFASWNVPMELIMIVVDLLVLLASLTVFFVLTDLLANFVTQVMVMILLEVLVNHASLWLVNFVLIVRILPIVQLVPTLVWQSIVITCVCSVATCSLTVQLASIVVTVWLVLQVNFIYFRWVEVNTVLLVLFLFQTVKLVQSVLIVLVVSTVHFTSR